MNIAATTLSFDLNQADRFLKRFDQNWVGTFQTIDEMKPPADATESEIEKFTASRKRLNLNRVLHGTLLENSAELMRINKAGGGVFVTINQTDLKGRTAANITRVRSVFVDLDEAPLEPVLKYMYPPNMVVQTSDEKWHAYWLIDDPENLFDVSDETEPFRRAQIALGERFGGDLKVQDLPRVMRLPGFYHMKGEPQLVRIHSISVIANYNGSEFYVEPSAQLDAHDDDPDGDPKSSAAEGRIVIERECAKVSNATKKNRNDTLNKVAFTLGGHVGAGDLDINAVRKALRAAAEQCGLHQDRGGSTAVDRTIESGLDAGKKKPIPIRTVLDAVDPMRSARAMVNAYYTDPAGLRTLHRHRATFWKWTGAHYDIVDNEEIESDTWAFLDKAKRSLREGGIGPFKPQKSNVLDIASALRSTARQPSTLAMPAWIGPIESETPPASEFMAVKNGLLHVPSGELWKPTASFFNSNSSNAVFDEDAPKPERWLAFLNQVFSGDVEAITALQDWFGYMLLPDTSQHKILLVIGPRRSGKGTIARILTEVLGSASVAGPTASSLGGPFGLQPLIPKRCAIIPDMRIGPQTNKTVVTERLLSISGEDMLTVDRKNTDSWHGKLNTGFVIMTNETPAFTDGAGALASRFIVLLMEVSFLNKEDPGLLNKLKVETSGILNWAIEGYHRLRQRGHFIQPKRSGSVMEEIEALASPVRAFIKDECEIGVGFSISTDELYDQYKNWCERAGIDRTSTKVWFSRGLTSAVPGLVVGTVNDVKAYKGIKLLSDAQRQRIAAENAKRQREEEAESAMLQRAAAASGGQLPF